MIWKTYHFTITHLIYKYWQLIQFWQLKNIFRVENQHHAYDLRQLLRFNWCSNNLHLKNPHGFSEIVNMQKQMITTITYIILIFNDVISNLCVDYISNGMSLYEFLKSLSIHFNIMYPFSTCTSIFIFHSYHSQSLLLTLIYCELSLFFWCGTWWVLDINHS